MTNPEPPAWYQIPREETGINVRPSGTQEDYGEPPFGDLFTEQIPKILGEIRQFFVDWPAHIKAGFDTGIDWLQTVADLDLEWLRTLLRKIVDTTAAVFDVSSWVAFLDTAITSAASLVADSFATVFDWVASLADGAVRFVEHSCNLDLTWLHDLIDQARVWSTSHVDLTSQDHFIDGVNAGGFWANIANLMLQGGASLLGFDSPLNAGNLFGQIGIPLTWLNNGATQALWNPGFDSPESLVGVKFQWDGTVYRTLSTDHQPGSVHISADSAVHALRSNPYDLKAGDKLDDISVWVAWAGLSAAAGAKPMQVSLLVVDANGTQYIDIAAVGAADGAAASGWTGLPAGAQGATLTGDWTATTDCTVVLRLVLDETASAGDVWFDAADMPVIGNGIPTEWLNGLVAAFGKMQAPFKTIGTFFDPTAWATAWEGFLDILGLEQVDNQIIANRDSIWTKLFQSVIPPSTLNLHPDMAAVNDELAIIFNPFDNNDLDRAEAWDDLMGLFGLESHTADSVAWWNNLFAANKNALANQSGVTDLSDGTRRNLNYLFGQFGFGYLNASWVWVSGTPSANDLPASGFTSLGGAPPAWLADILKAFGIPVGPDLPSQLDPTRPAAPVLLWPLAQVSTTTTVPQSTNLYYVATVVKDDKESAPSNEVMIYIAPSWLVAKAKVVNTWLALPAEATLNLYRRTSPTGQYRQIATGLTGTSFTDALAATAGTTTQPGSAAATAATIINGEFTTTNTNHQNLMDTIVQVGQDTTDTGHSTADVGNTLSQWPATHVSGPAEMSAYLVMQQTLSQLTSGLADDTLTDVSPSDAGAAAQTVSQRASLALLMAQTALLETRARAIWRCGDPSADPTIPVSSVLWSSTTAGMALGGGAVTPFPNGRQSFGGLIVVEAGGPRNYVDIMVNARPSASGSPTVTDVRVALYFMDSTGALVPLPGYTPGNVASTIPYVGQVISGVTVAAGSVWTCRFSLPTFLVGAANVIGVELINMSTGGALQFPLGQVSGSSSWVIPTAAFTRANAAINATTPVATIPRSSIAWSPMCPFMSLGYSGGGAVLYPDDVQMFSASGIWTPPTWWRPGIDFLDVGVLGAGGSGGTGVTGPGHGGASSSVDVPGYRTVTGLGGLAGPGGTTSVANSTGKSPGNKKTAAGRLLVGGGPASIVAGFPSAGKAPGGGSSGAYFGGLYAYGGGAGGWDVLDDARPNVTSLAVTVGDGGDGVNTGVWASLNAGDGRVWIIARQNRNV